MPFRNHAEAGVDHFVFGSFFLAFFLALGLPVAAAETAKRSAREILALELMRPRDGQEWKALMDDGETRAEFCVRCHGREGTSANPLVPNLAGQNPYYLLDQIERFANGQRQDFIMSPLARKFSEQDRAAVAFFFANKPPPYREAEVGTARMGEKIFTQRCTGCHGRDAHGSDKFARLAGQHPGYLQRRLKAFKEANDRSISPMSAIAAGLNAGEIEALATYLSSLP